MKLFLPDTNIFIYANKGEEPFASLISDWISQNSLAISSIVAAEFLSGGDDLERNKFQSLIDRFGTLPVDTTIAGIAADYKRKYAKVKPSLKLPDCLIAATAKLYNAQLITTNASDFPMSDIAKKSI